MGAYSHSKGNLFIRQEVADFISRQNDNIKVNPENIIIGNGASEIVRLVIQMLIATPSDGIMVSIPQYPLYSAAIALYAGNLVPYYLDEDHG
jgi:aspartate/methionine/tyrosine aminotransferase